MAVAATPLISVPRPTDAGCPVGTGGFPPAQEPTLAADFSGRSFQVGVGDRIETVEKRLILATVQHTHTKEAAAEILGISVKTLYNRLRAYESGADLRANASSETPAAAPTSPGSRTPAT